MSIVDNSTERENAAAVVVVVEYTPKHINCSSWIVVVVVVVELNTNKQQQNC